MGFRILVDSRFTLPPNYTRKSISPKEGYLEEKKYARLNGKLHSSLHAIKAFHTTPPPQVAATTSHELYA